MCVYLCATCVLYMCVFACGMTLFSQGVKGPTYKGPLSLGEGDEWDRRDHPFLLPPSVIPRDADTWVPENPGFLGWEVPGGEVAVPSGAAASRAEATRPGGQLGPTLVPLQMGCLCGVCQSPSWDPISTS